MMLDIILLVMELLALSSAREMNPSIALRCIGFQKVVCRLIAHCFRWRACAAAELLSSSGRMMMMSAVCSLAKGAQLNQQLQAGLPP